MHATIKGLEKMDALLEEADEYAKLASAHKSERDLHEAYVDLAKCHIDGYLKLRQACDRMTEHKREALGQGDKTIYDDFCVYLKSRLDKKYQEVKTLMDTLR